MRGTAVVEGCGAVLLSFRFVPMLGWAKGIWYSVFHSISAFCNAGFDLMGPISGEFTSLESFVGDPFVNGVVIMLILLAGWASSFGKTCSKTACIGRSCACIPAWL